MHAIVSKAFTQGLDDVIHAGADATCNVWDTETTSAVKVTYLPWF
jgi:hypothetical protein